MTGRVTIALNLAVLLLVGSSLGTMVGFADETKPTAPEPPQLPAATDAGLKDRVLEIWRETQRLRAAGKVDEAGALAKRLAPFVQQIQGSPEPRADQRTELHAVGLYQGQVVQPPAAGEKHPLGEAEVRVDFTGQPLIVALSAYEPVKWRLRLADGVVLKQVILTGYYGQQIEGVPKDVQVINDSGGKARMFAFRKREARDFAEWSGHLRQVTGREVATFQGNYRYRGQPFVLGPGSDAWRTQLLTHRLDELHRSATRFQRMKLRERFQAIRFQAVYFTSDAKSIRFHDYRAALATFTPSGPIAPSIKSLPEGLNHWAVDPRGPRHFALQGHDLVEVDIAAGTAGKIAFDPQHDISWPSGLAFDSRRKRLVVATNGGKGQLVAYDLKNRRWSQLGDLNNLDLQCLTYAPELDLFYGVALRHGSDGLTAMASFGPDGKLRQVTSFERPLPSPDDHPHGVAQVVAVGKLVMVIPLPFPDVDVAGAPIQARGYLVDPATGKILHSEVLKPHSGRREFKPTELAATWKQLLTSDAAEAELLMWQMAAGGGQTVAFLQKQVVPLPQKDAKLIKSLIADLDADQFKVRQAALTKLAQMGDLAAAELTDTLKTTQSVEVRSNVRRLLAAVSKLKPASPELRRDLRAVTVLGRTGTEAGIELLRQLAAERPGAMRSRLARETLERLGDR